MTFSAEEVDEVGATVDEVGATVLSLVQDLRGGLVSNEEDLRRFICCIIYKK